MVTSESTLNIFLITIYGISNFLLWSYFWTGKENIYLKGVTGYLSLVICVSGAIRKYCYDVIN